MSPTPVSNAAGARTWRHRNSTQKFPQSETTAPSSEDDAKSGRSFRGDSARAEHRRKAVQDITATDTYSFASPITGGAVPRRFAWRLWIFLADYVLLYPLACVVGAVLVLVSCALWPFATSDSDPRNRIPGVPTLVDPELEKQRKWRRMRPAVIDAAEAFPPSGGRTAGGAGASANTQNVLSDFMARSEPVIVRNLHKIGVDAAADLRGATSTPEREAARAAASEASSTHLFMEINYGPFCLFGTSLHRFIAAYCKRSVLYIARFAGGYTAGLGHIDSMASYNFYFVIRGRKRVYIVPRQFNPSRLERIGEEAEAGKLEFTSGMDNVYWPRDTTDEESLGEALPRVPAVWEFELEAGDLLLFNNSACCHKFVNLTKDAEIYTLRLTNWFGVSPLTLRNDMLNWRGVVSSARLILNGGASERDVSYL